MSDFTAHRTKIIPSHVEGAGDVWVAQLIAHDEDGPRVEFHGWYIDRKDADAVAAMWRNEQQRKLLWLVRDLVGIHD